MDYLTQSFSDLAWLGKDSWECHPRFIASKYSLNPQVLITRTKADFNLNILQYKIKFIKTTGMYIDFVDYLGWFSLISTLEESPVAQRFG
jgi:hypothetical protein